MELVRNSHYFKRRQIIDAIPVRWKYILQSDRNSLLNTYENLNKDQHLLYLARRLPLERLTSRQLYDIFIYNLKQKPTSEANISISLNMDSICWKKVYVLANKSTIDNYARQLHFKVTHNILYLNKSLFRMGLSVTKLCPFCNTF